MVTLGIIYVAIALIISAIILAFEYEFIGCGDFDDILGALYHGFMWPIYFIVLIVIFIKEDLCQRS